MRTDHHAYRKATGVAGFGLLLQGATTLTLLVFGMRSHDTPLLFAAGYAAGGLLVWLSLVAVFFQHRQERLESLETDELAAARGGFGGMGTATGRGAGVGASGGGGGGGAGSGAGAGGGSGSGGGSIFQSGGAEEGPGARRLRLMHKWLMPTVSLLLAAWLALAAWLMLAWLDRLGATVGGTDFELTEARGCAVAICLAIALFSFIFSRFVAGMARHPAWQNLRGGAGVMVGNALVLLAVSVGLIFRFFDKDQPIFGVAWAIPIFMIVMAGEIAFNFVLNLYRPRRAGETPRPAFDSRVLSLLAAPESIVQSVGEAVNYQFGFDITSSWGYKLLLRSFGWLLAFGAIVLLALNMMVVVEPSEQGVIISGGDIAGEPGHQVHGAGIMWKLPWPLQSAAVYDVSSIREMPLTAQRRLRPGEPDLWNTELRTDTALDPFLVGSSLMRDAAALPDLEAGADAGDATSVSDLFALVEAEITLQYRIRPGGLLDYLAFSSTEPRRRQGPDTRQQALKAMALREITQHLSRASLEEVIAAGQAGVIRDLERRIQAAFDLHRTGIEVVRLNVPMIRPAGQVAAGWEDLAIARQNRLKTVAAAQGKVAGDLARYVGDPALTDAIVEAVDRHRELRIQAGADAPETIAQRQRVEELLQKAGGMLGQMIAGAEAERWITVMQAWARARQLEGQLAAYRAAPELFKQREIMRVIAKALATRRKYVLVGIDPRVLNLDITLEEASSIFSISPQGESKP